MTQLWQTIKATFDQLRTQHRRRLPFLSPPIERRRPRILAEDYAARHSIEHTLDRKAELRRLAEDRAGRRSPLSPAAHVRAGGAPGSGGRARDVERRPRPPGVHRGVPGGDRAARDRGGLVPDPREAMGTGDPDA